MGVQGADLDGLTRLKATFERQSGALQAIMGGASSGVAALDQLWVGPDAGQFRTVWNNVHRRSLAAAVTALTEAAATVERNRRAQDTASAADGPGGLGGPPPSTPPTVYQGEAPGDPVPTARPAEEIFSEDYMNAFIGRRVQGENSPELNGLLEQVLADDGTDPARLQANLDRIADIRGVDRHTFRQQHATYQQLLAADRGVDGPSIDLDRHGDFLGSTASLRYGSVVGDVYGIDPVFGALLNPTGGLVGGGDNSYNPGENDAVGYHGIFHDAAGYLKNRQGTGPGYDYLGRESGSTDSPTTGQYGGISWWVGQHPELDADLSEVAAVFEGESNPWVVAPVRAAHYLGLEERIGDGLTLVEGSLQVGHGLDQIAHGDAAGLGQIVEGGGNVVIGMADNALDRANKRVELGFDVTNAAVHAVPDLVDHVGDLGTPFAPLTGLLD